MKIGVMVRDIDDQLNAPGIITKNLLDHMLKIDKQNEYVLFYKNNVYFERYADHPNVKRVIVNAPNKFIWDQFAIPRACKRENIDLLFHPKHSIPLSVNCKTLMHLRGSDYWNIPEHFNKLELFYQKFMLPIMCKKATHLIFESKFVKGEFQRFLTIPEEKTSIIYLAYGENFNLISNEKNLESIRKKYHLPSEFFLTVTRIHEGKKFYSGKNIINIIKSFQQCKSRQNAKLVIAGKKVRAFIKNFKEIDNDVKDDIIALDSVPQKDLPFLYNLAKCFLFPSNYESFGLPIIEAMACGCPVITSNTTACPEISGKAAILVNPNNVDEISHSIDQLYTDEQLRNELREKGLKEVKRFSWKKSAEQTVAIINEKLNSDNSKKRLS